MYEGVSNMITVRTISVGSLVWLAGTVPASQAAKPAGSNESLRSDVVPIAAAQPAASQDVRSIGFDSARACEPGLSGTFAQNAECVDAEPISGEGLFAFDSAGPVTDDRSLVTG